jgi:hypothetical protein
VLLLVQIAVAAPRRVPAKQGHNQAMASAEADENTPKGGEPGPGPVTDETGRESVQLIAMSDAASRMGALMLGSGTGSFRVLQAMRQVAAALGIDRLQAQVTLTHIVSTATRSRRSGWRRWTRCGSSRASPPSSGSPSGSAHRGGSLSPRPASARWPTRRG